MKNGNLIFAAFLVMGSFGSEAFSQNTAPFILDVPYVATPDTVVAEMFRLAAIKKDDILYDLGSGDGRIPIAAAKQYGIKAVGVELNPERIREAKENARIAEVDDKVEFLEADIFDSDFSEATILTMYLFPEVNLKLRPKILQMKSGTRIISHKYTMGDWKPEETRTIIGPEGKEHKLYLWRVPPDGIAEFK